MTEIRRHVHNRHHMVAAIVCLTLIAWLIFAFVGGAVFAAAGGNSGGNGIGVANANGSGNGNGVENGNGAGVANAPGLLKKQDPVAPVVVDPPAPPAAAGAVSSAPPSPATQNPGSKNPGSKNPGGANNGGDCGAYCSTTDGSPALNGNGNGRATGKPCAGCVGKADNKNPPGQRPNGSDPNKGYECDANHGIGKSNPAHSSCKPKSPPDCHQTGTCPTTPPTDCHQTGTCPTTPPTCEQTGTCSPPPKCLPSEDNNFCSPVQANHHTKNGPPVKVLGEKVVRTTPPPNELPFTGAELAPMVAIATLAVVAGSWLVVSAGMARRRTTTARP